MQRADDKGLLRFNEGIDGACFAAVGARKVSVFSLAGRARLTLRTVPNRRIRIVIASYDHILGDIAKGLAPTRLESALFCIRPVDRSAFCATRLIELASACKLC